MAEILTAAQARALDPANAASEWLHKISEQIKVAAQRGQTTTRLPYDLTEIRGEGAVAPKGTVGALVVKTLEGLGYVVTSQWDCGGQFVDAHLLISWGQDE